MLINLDFRALEWVIALYLSQDEVGIQEWKDVLTGKIEDIHEINQKRFGLRERVVAKTFLFRIIYGGTVFHTSPDFSHVSKNPKFWDQVVQEFYTKYYGLKEWHKQLLHEATTTGQVDIPSGRIFYFEPLYGRWPRTQILNYPVQGLAADLVAISRVSLWKRIYQKGLQEKALFVSSIHDSITLDVINDEQIIHQVVILMKEVINDLPYNFERVFKIPFNLELSGEIQAGMTKGNMAKYET